MSRRRKATSRPFLRYLLHDEQRKHCERVRQYEVLQLLVFTLAFGLAFCACIVCVLFSQHIAKVQP